MVLIVYNSPKLGNETEQIVNDNEGTVRMVQESARHALLGNGKVLIMGDFICKEIEWDSLDSSWK